ncbi:VOC family protein [uncultured Ramlibacter sp.]|uniref:VOC family protein n=1 Tax=uncultured Ramlibacter sp. TaxID=260755 RepID=UPI0026074C90|nr:VOC family protein [uncultured Ramlibacter sp.]
MLKEMNAMATIAVKEVARSRKFYEGQLGLQADGPGEPGLAAYRSGGSTLMLYESAFAGSNRATCATWAVTDGIESLVQSLKERGVAFEHYDLPQTTRQGDIHVSGARKTAWCKDPDGNILCFAQD